MLRVDRAASVFATALSETSPAYVHSVTFASWVFAENFSLACSLLLQIDVLVSLDFSETLVIAVEIDLANTSCATGFKPLLKFKETCYKTIITYDP